MFQFPMGASLAPGQVIIIAQNAANFHAVYGFNPDFEIAASSPVVPDMRKVLSWASGTISLENNGDEVLLLDGADLLADALSWGNSSWAFYPPCPAPLTEWSLERYPVYIDTNTSNDWRTQPIPTPGTVNLTPPTPTPSLTPTRTPTPTTPGGGLLVSEVLYDPFSAEPAGEWIELYNASGETIDLANYKVGDKVVPGNPEGMYQFPSGASIETGQVIIVADRADVFTNTYGFYPDYEYIDSDGNVPDMSKYIPWAIWVVNLSNPGDEVLVLDENDYFEDAISWGDSNWAFDPPCPVIAEGHSLERYPAEVDTDTAADWIDQAVPNPGQVNLY